MAEIMDQEFYYFICLYILYMSAEHNIILQCKQMFNKISKGKNYVWFINAVHKITFGILVKYVE